MNKMVQSAQFLQGRPPSAGALGFRLKRDAARKKQALATSEGKNADLTSFSKKELGRIETLVMLDRDLINAAEAQRLLNVGRSQMFKLLQKYRRCGPAAACSRKRGRVSNNAFPAVVRNTVLSLIKDHYLDYGPTLTAEVLLEIHGIRVSPETIRQWRLAAGLWIDDRVARKRIHIPRGRSSSFGELLQIDGSDHRWFEYRAPRCTLMVCVDDATSKLTALHFCARENREAYFRTTICHLEAYGRPVRILSDKHAAVYTADRDSIYTTALSQLRVIHSVAHTAQSKGRVERMNRTLQDRLVKALRRAGINSIEEANAYAPRFIADFNSKFAHTPLDENDAHRPLVEPADARRAFARKFHRRISRSLTFTFEGERYIVEPRRLPVSLVGKRAAIEIDIDGNMCAYYDEPLRIIKG